MKTAMEFTEEKKYKAEIEKLSAKITEVKQMQTIDCEIFFSMIDM